MVWVPGPTVISPRVDKEGWHHFFTLGTYTNLTDSTAKQDNPFPLRGFNEIILEDLSVGIVAASAGIVFKGVFQDIVNGVVRSAVHPNVWTTVYAEDYFHELLNAYFYLQTRPLYLSFYMIGATGTDLCDFSLFGRCR